MPRSSPSSRDSRVDRTASTLRAAMQDPSVTGSQSGFSSSSDSSGLMEALDPAYVKIKTGATGRIKSYVIYRGLGFITMNDVPGSSSLSFGPGKSVKDVLLMQKYLDPDASRLAGLQYGKLHKVVPLKMQVVEFDLYQKPTGQLIAYRVRGERGQELIVDEEWILQADRKSLSEKIVKLEVGLRDIKIKQEREAAGLKKQIEKERAAAGRKVQIEKAREVERRKVLVQIEKERAAAGQKVMIEQALEVERRKVQIENAREAERQRVQAEKARAREGGEAAGQSEQGMCLVCKSEKAVMMYSPCNHIATCVSCSETPHASINHKCGVCRMENVIFVRVYFP